MNALRPIGCPAGVDPVDWRNAVSKRIEQMAEAMANLIDALDQMDGDADLEPNGDELDVSAPEGWRPFDTNLLDDSEDADEGEESDPAEPMLGSPEQNPHRWQADQTKWAGGRNTFRSDDAEDENEHGGAFSTSRTPLPLPERG